ncbi:MAG: hypothetical protein ACXWBP_03645 [Limisphaerales bacterium]
MRISSKGRVGIGIVGLLAVVGLVVWWALQQGKLPTLPPTITQASDPANARTSHGTNGSATQANAAEASAKEAEMTAEVVDPPEVPEPKTWEDHLDDILLSDDNENTKADQILALMQTSPAENQEELAQHLVNMVQDNHYDGASNLLMNINTQTNVAEVLMNDLLNRNNTLKLKTLLQIVKMPDHPLHENAREMLELFVQEDHGTNYEEWEKAVGDWLKENEPEPQAQAQATAPDAPAPQ